MFGSYEEKFASYRTLLAYYLSLPGKKLMFMGGEFAQFIEWRYEEGLEWHLLDIDAHKKLKDYVKEVNNFYLENPPLWENDQNWEGFNWVNEQDRDNSVLSYKRIDKNGDEVLVVANFTPVDRQKYYLPVPEKCEYEVVMNSDWKRFGGKTPARARKYKSVRDENKNNVLKIDISGLSAIYLKKCERKMQK
jgi:1,4-alpha-glucan branching enzyme